jgi:hypothetical protein
MDLPLTIEAPQGELNVVIKKKPLSGFGYSSTFESWG